MESWPPMPISTIVTTWPMGHVSSLVHSHLAPNTIQPLQIFIAEDNRNIGRCVKITCNSQFSGRNVFSGMTMPIHFHIIYGCLCAAVAKVSHRDWDNTARRAIHLLSTLYFKMPPILSLEKVLQCVRLTVKAQQRPRWRPAPTLTGPMAVLPPAHSPNTPVNILFLICISHCPTSVFSSDAPLSVNHTSGLHVLLTISQPSSKLFKNLSTKIYPLSLSLHNSSCTVLGHTSFLFCILIIYAHVLFPL